jgi:Icc-related predicted phosphoesterase
MASVPCFFVSDLHGRLELYEKLLAAVRQERPRVVLLGGDLLPFDRHWSGGEFVQTHMIPLFEQLRSDLGEESPLVLLIFGNDDPRERESRILDGQRRGIWQYLHQHSMSVDRFEILGYACVPPTPFLLKDWERYDVSRFVDPGCVSPEEGHRTVEVQIEELRTRTIADDLARLAGDGEIADAVFLFHSPPYRTRLDRAALDGRTVDGVPLDPHVGSIAIRRLIEERQPLLTLHGHIHESASLTGSWRDRIGRTHMFNAAHEGPELSLVRLDLEDLDNATRELV